jgi:hypothetical protein
VKKITRRNSPANLEKVIADLNPLIREFANYSRIANCKGIFRELSQWIGRRLRAKQLALWKKPKRLHRRLRQLGVQSDKDEFVEKFRKSSCQLCDTRQILQGTRTF